MKRKFVSILLSLILILITVSGSVLAVSQKDLDATKEKIEEEKDKKEEVNAQKKTALEEISDLEDSINTYEMELQKLNDKITRLQGNIKTKTAEIEKLQKEFDEKQQLLTDRLVAIYEEGQPTMLDVLLSSSSISDYISGTAMVEQLAEADNKQLNDLEDARHSVEKAKKELEQQKVELDSSKKSVQSKTVQLRTAKANQEVKVANLNAEEKKIQAKIDDYNKELKKIEAQIREQAKKAQNVYNGSFSGKLGWPLSQNSERYNVITSGFGPRNSPVAGASSNHRGIDIGVSIGTPVFASADGYVVSVMQTGVRGKFVLIKHADDLYTRYQHLNSYTVSAGQYVKRGQIIAYSGNTGIGSGPHLHFEVLTTPYYMTELNPLTCGLVSLPPLRY